jgi:hypothetical protein
MLRCFSRSLSGRKIQNNTLPKIWQSVHKDMFASGPCAQHDPDHLGGQLFEYLLGIGYLMNIPKVRTAARAIFHSMLHKPLVLKISVNNHNHQLP